MLSHYRILSSSSCSYQASNVGRKSRAFSSCINYTGSHPVFTFDKTRSRLRLRPRINQGVQIIQRRNNATTSTLMSQPSGSELLELMNSKATSTVGTIFSDMGPVIYVQELLCGIKDLDGLSWVQVILYSTIVIRLFTGLPTTIAQQRAIKRLENTKPEIEKLAKDLNKETALAIMKFGWDEKTAKIQYRKSFKKHWRKIMEEHNCHPMKSLCLGLIQVPIWISFSSAIRNVVFGLPLPRTEDQARLWYDMCTGGTPWFDNLTVPDPFVLPMVFLSANLLNIYLHTKNKPSGAIRTKLQTALPWIFTGGVTIIAGFATVVPSAVTLYWATSSSVALAQNIVLMHPGLRKRLKMPIYSSSPTTPIQPSNP